MSRIALDRSAGNPARGSRPARLSRVRAALLPRSRSALACAAAIVVVALETAWYVVRPGDHALQDRATDWITPAIDLAAGVLALRAAAGSRRKRIRRTWSLIGVAMIVYTLGDAIWSSYDLATGSVPYPSFADAAYVAFYPLMAAAVLLFPGPESGPRERHRLILDGAIVLVGGGMVVWQSLLRPALSAGATDPLTAGLTIGYPIGDLVLLFGLATLALRRPSGVNPLALVSLVAGLLLMFGSDVAYGELSLADAALLRWADLGYLWSSAAIGLAAYLQTSRSHRSRLADSPRLSRLLLLLPYAALAAGYGVLVTSAAGHAVGAFGDLLVGAGVLTALVLARQEVVLRENSRLLALGERMATEARFHTLEANASDAIVLVDRACVVRYTSPSVERILGAASGSILGHRLMRLAHADDIERLERLIAECASGVPQSPLEWRLWGRDGVWRQVETVAVNRLDDPAIEAIVLTTRDIRERRALRQELSEVALHDLLTGLPNRALFRDRLEHALASARQAGDRTAILMLDLDGFKRLNDSLGHAIGDEVLREVARRIESTIRTVDSGARLGGDEFGILVGGPADVAEVHGLAERLQAALAAPLPETPMPTRLTACIGIAVTGEGVEASEPRSLIRDADLALVAARRTGRGEVVTFQPAMQEALEGEVALEGDLRRAIGADELMLQYQPIVDLSSGEVIGAEALVRWNHPERGRLGPSLFIPIAEEAGLIGQIGTWVLHTACREVARWAREAPGAVPHVAVNLSALQLADPQLPWIIQSALAQAGAAPGWLALEVTESMLVQDTDAVLERLHSIRALGVSISVDDFGTGYSSLAYLEHFPVNHIKIDRSFVSPLDDPARGPGLAGAVVEIGRALGMATIAEGIETELQLERLRAMGCKLGQGYLFGRPLDADAFRAHLTEASRRSSPEDPVAVVNAA